MNSFPPFSKVAGIADYKLMNPGSKLHCHVSRPAIALYNFIDHDALLFLVPHLSLCTFKSIYVLSAVIQRLRHCIPFSHAGFRPSIRAHIIFEAF
jgi:hypothetical protein